MDLVTLLCVIVVGSASPRDAPASAAEASGKEGAVSISLLLPLLSPPLRPRPSSQDRDVADEQDPADPISPRGKQ